MLVLCNALRTAALSFFEILWEIQVTPDVPHYSRPRVLQYWLKELLARCHNAKRCMWRFLFHCWPRLAYGMCSCSIVGLTWHQEYVIFQLLTSFEIWSSCSIVDSLAIWNIFLFHFWPHLAVEYILFPFLASLNTWNIFSFNCWPHLTPGICSCSIVGLTWHLEYILIQLLVSHDTWNMFLFHCWPHLTPEIYSYSIVGLTWHLEYILVPFLASLDTWNILFFRYWSHLTSAICSCSIVGLTWHCNMFLFYCWPHLTPAICSCSIVGLTWYLDYVLVLQPPWHLDSRRAGD